MGLWYRAPGRYNMLNRVEGRGNYGGRQRSRQPSGTVAKVRKTGTPLGATTTRRLASTTVADTGRAREHKGGQNNQLNNQVAFPHMTDPTNKTSFM